MFRCAPVAEPKDFNAKVRVPGNAWLAKNTGSKKRPPAHWRAYNALLAKVFHERCAYSAMFLSAPGTVDHFVPINEDRSQTYEWSNYRYAAGWINSKKESLRSQDILDPLKAHSSWFEVQLPSLQLEVSALCPGQYRATAENTIVKLGLRDDERVLRYRRQWLQEYEKREIELDYLMKKAPLIAQAVKRWEEREGRRWAPVNPPSPPARIGRTGPRRRPR